MQQHQYGPSTTESQRNTMVGGASTMVGGVINTAGDIARTTISEVADIGTELVHAAGRLGGTAVDEVFLVISRVANGLGNTAGALVRQGGTGTRTSRSETGDGGVSGTETEKTSEPAP